MNSRLVIAVPNYFKYIACVTVSQISLQKKNKTKTTHQAGADEITYHAAADPTQSNSKKGKYVLALDT